MVIDEENAIHLVEFDGLLLTLSSPIKSQLVKQAGFRHVDNIDDSLGNIELGLKSEAVREV